MRLGAARVLPNAWGELYMAFCDAYPIGTPVRVMAPDGSQHDTITIGLPILTGDGAVVIPLQQPPEWVDVNAVKPWPDGGMA